MLNHHRRVYTHKFELFISRYMGRLWSHVTLKWTPIFELHIVSFFYSLNEILLQNHVLS